MKMIDHNFVKKCNSPEFQEYVSIYRKNQKKIYKPNKEKFKKSQEKYKQSDKGKFACTFRDFNSRKKYIKSKQNITIEEKVLIGRFYKNCPEGYVVDHIIPVCMGGKHILKNLQYLTKKENILKRDKIDWEKELYNFYEVSKKQSEM